jgi:hypothetical protein
MNDYLVTFGTGVLLLRMEGSHVFANGVVIFKGLLAEVAREMTLSVRVSIHVNLHGTDVIKSCNTMHYRHVRNKIGST